MNRKHLTDDRLVWSARRPSRVIVEHEAKIGIGARGTAAGVGPSLVEFRRRAGLAYSTVLVWRRKAREAAVLSPPVFVEVEALPSGPVADPGNGRAIAVVAGQPWMMARTTGGKERAPASLLLGVLLVVSRAVPPEPVLAGST